MEDITKYIGLLGFVPFVIVFVFVNIMAIKNQDSEAFVGISILMWILLSTGGLFWGITTLGGLL